MLAESALIIRLWPRCAERSAWMRCATTDVRQTYGPELPDHPVSPFDGQRRVAVAISAAVKQSVGLDGRNVTEQRAVASEEIGGGTAGGLFV